MSSSFFKFAGACLLALQCLLTAPLVLAHAEHGRPQYGGQVGEAGLFQAELVISGSEASLYLTQHGEPIAAKGATGTLRLLMGGVKHEVPLLPDSGNRLRAKLPAVPTKGSVIVVTVQPAGMAPANIRYSRE